MHILPSTPLLASTSMSNAGEISVEARYRVPTVEHMLSNVRNDNASAPPLELPTYEEAMAESPRVEAQSGVNDLPYYFKPLSRPLSEKDKVVGQWEAKKWVELKDTVINFAKSPMTMEAGMFYKAVEPAVRAMATLAEMSMTPPPVANSGDPYWQLMDGANTVALNELASLCRDLRTRAESMQQYNPSYPAHFNDMANKISDFVIDKMPVGEGQFQREQQRFSEMTRNGAENVG